MQKIVIDTETYKDYFLLSCLNIESGNVRHFEFYEGQPLDTKTIKQIMTRCLTISFNGNGFDLPIIVAALKGYSVLQIKKLADKIIKSNRPSWLICKDLGLSIPRNWDHIDLIEVAPGQSSLKIYGGRLHAPKLQDLPIEPNASIAPEQRKLMRDYCVNDLDTTALLYSKLEKQVALRESMSKQYGVDLRSKSDAQIAETVIKSELQKMTGEYYGKTELGSNTKFRYRNPEIIGFETEQLKSIFDKVLTLDFTLGANGSVKMPQELADAKIKIGNSEYNMGIGGLHSCEKSQYIYADKEHVLLDVDVASYYPSIILQQQLAPKSLGQPFLEVYQSIVTRRLQAKREGDKVTADTLKICVNGSFGKLGSKWSALYAPDLLIQTTITGQLALLMLIEKLELEGISVVSANTDGVVIHAHKDRLDDLRNIAFDWMLETSYELEETHYRCIASRDVNTYVAVTTDGEAKRKGAFANGGLAKNPDCSIAFDAVAAFLANGTPVEQTINDCDDITKFVLVRRVTGGAEWKGQYLGKAVRFYYSDDFENSAQIDYAKNGNKVSKSDGCKPLMDLPESLPTDIDRPRYIDMAKKLLCEVGYVRA